MSEPQKHTEGVGIEEAEGGVLEPQWRVRGTSIWEDSLLWVSESK